MSAIAHLRVLTFIVVCLYGDASGQQLIPIRAVECSDTASICEQTIVIGRTGVVYKNTIAGDSLGIRKLTVLFKHHSIDTGHVFQTVRDMISFRQGVSVFVLEILTNQYKQEEVIEYATPIRPNEQHPNIQNRPSLDPNSGTSQVESSGSTSYSRGSVVKSRRINDPRVVMYLANSISELRSGLHCDVKESIWSEVWIMKADQRITSEDRVPLVAKVDDAMSSFWSYAIYPVILGLGIYIYFLASQP